MSYLMVRFFCLYLFFLIPILDIRFFIDSLDFPNALTDLMEPGSFIMGDLQILGWAIYRGVNFDKSIIDKFDTIPESRWDPLQLDSNRKYYVFQDNETKYGRKLVSVFQPMMTNFFKLFEGTIVKKGTGG